MRKAFPYQDVIIIAAEKYPSSYYLHEYCKQSCGPKADP